ncbi:MAG TPA: class I SAM-dependent methyltransferase [Stellaceae bacterium]|nr:class I SAM-dependent methyltransferase [Stellaceae bacterium]
MSFPDLNLKTRFHAIRKLATRSRSYLLVTIRPDDMIVPRPASYVLRPVERRLEAARPTIEALLTRLAPTMDQARRSLGALAANRFFAGGDAEAAYAMIKDLRPKRVIEIGSGNSTHIMRRAAGDAGLNLHITCIDPMPRREIESVADSILRRSVIETEPSDIAATLGPGDILFIDGSHYSFNGTDAPFLMLEVLPLLQPGVIVHVHDIMLPYEYDALFSERNYNEQYLVAGLLLGGSDWEPLLPVYWLSRAGRMAHGASFWMRRRETEGR